MRSKKVAADAANIDDDQMGTVTTDIIPNLYFITPNQKRQGEVLYDGV